MCYPCIQEKHLKIAIFVQLH